MLDSLRRLAIGRTVILASHSAAAQNSRGRRLDMRDGRRAAGQGPGGGRGGRGMSGAVGMNDLLRILGLWRPRAWLAGARRGWSLSWPRWPPASG